MNYKFNGNIDVTGQIQQNGGDLISVSNTGTSTTYFSYLTINGTEYQVNPLLSGGANWGHVTGNIDSQTDLKERFTHKVFVNATFTVAQIKSDITNNSYTVKDKNGTDITSAVSNGDYDSTIANEDFDTGSKKIVYSTTMYVVMKTDTTEYTLYPVEEYFLSGDLIIVLKKTMEPGSGMIPISPGGNFDVFNTRVYNQGIKYTRSGTGFPIVYDETPIYSFTLQGSVTYKKTYSLTKTISSDRYEVSVEKLTTDPAEPTTVNFEYVMKNGRIVEVEKRTDSGGYTYNYYYLACFDSLTSDSNLSLTYFGSTGSASHIDFRSPIITLETVEEI